MYNKFSSMLLVFNIFQACLKFWSNEFQSHYSHTMQYVKSFPSVRPAFKHFSHIELLCHTHFKYKFQMNSLQYSGVARPGPSRARPDLIIDYHIMDITVLAVESACKTAKPRQRFMFIASELAQNFASYSRSSSFF